MKRRSRQQLSDQLMGYCTVLQREPGSTRRATGAVGWVLRATDYLVNSCLDRTISALRARLNSGAFE